MGREHQGIAAIEHGKGRKRIKAAVECAEASGGALQGAFDGAVEAGAEIGEVLAGMEQVTAGIVVEKCGGESCDAGLPVADLRGEGGLEAKDQVVEALCGAVEERGDARLGAVEREAGKACAGCSINWKRAARSSRCDCVAR